MYKNKSITAVIPCHNESSQIENVLRTMPDWMDHMVVVDDYSKDNTVDIVKQFREKDNRVVLLEHNKNRGVGAAIASGYIWARDNDADAAVVMAGDGQMDPADLPNLLDPIVSGEVEYTKTNRLFSGEAYRKIPKVRYFGNAILSMLTKIASGYWHIADSQSGFTAISKLALQTIDWHKMYTRYGQPNDLLVRLNIFSFRVRDVIAEPVYNVGERSGLKIHSVIFSISWLLLILFLYRMKEKYIIRDFHPLIFFYTFGIVLLGSSFPIFLKNMISFFNKGYIPNLGFLAWVFAVIMGIQFILFAMWFDMESNKDLK